LSAFIYINAYTKVIQPLTQKLEHVTRLKQLEAVGGSVCLGKPRFARNNRVSKTTFSQYFVLKCKFIKVKAKHENEKYRILLTKQLSFIYEITSLLICLYFVACRVT